MAGPMSVERTQSILKLIGAKVPPDQSRAGWVISTCPLAPWRHASGVDKNPSFGVKADKGDARVHCFSCGFSGTIIDMVHTIRHHNKMHPEVEIDWSQVMGLVNGIEDEWDLDLDQPTIEEMLFSKSEDAHVFPDWWLESFPPALTIPEASGYLAARGVDYDTAEMLDLRCDTNQGRICFPVRDFQGRLLGLHGRAMHAETEPRYRMYTQGGCNNPMIWLGENWVDLSLPIVVVEGPFDVAAVLPVYSNVVSPLFANPNVEKIRRMQDCLEWVTLLDTGVAGDHGRHKIEQVLGEDHVVEHLYMPGHRKDPGECSREEILGLFGDSALLGVS